jgi:hypothetical protein
VIRKRIELAQQRLQDYLQIEQRDFSGNMDSRERKLQHLVLKAGIAAERLRIEQAQEALQILALPPTR